MSTLRLLLPLGAALALLTAAHPPQRCQPYAETCPACVDCSRCGYCSGKANSATCSVCRPKKERPPATPQPRR